MKPLTALSVCMFASRLRAVSALLCIMLVLAQTLGASHLHGEDSDHGRHGVDCLLCFTAEQSKSPAAESGDNTFPLAQHAPLETRTRSFPVNTASAPYQSRAPPKTASI